MQKLLLTEPETIEVLGLSRSTLRRFWTEGKLVPLKIGRSVRWAVTDIEAFVAHLREEHRK